MIRTIIGGAMFAATAFLTFPSAQAKEDYVYGPKPGWADYKAMGEAALRAQLSPRHVPDEIHQVPGIPRTLSGKKLEVPVRKILHGTDPERAADPNALADPDVLRYFGRFQGESPAG